jgi:hypothetical protein
MAYFTYFERYPLASLAVLIILLPLGLAVYRYSWLDEAFRLLFYFLCLDLVLGVGMIHLAAHRTNNILMLNLFVPFRYIALSGMFYHKFQSKRCMKAILYSMVAFVPFTLIDIYTSNPVLSDLHNHRVGKYSQVVESLLIIGWALLYLYEITKTLQVKNIISYPFFWVCAGLLLFYSGNIFYFPFWHYMYIWKDDLKLGFVEEVPNIVEIISLLLFSIGIFQTRAHHDSPES